MLQVRRAKGARVLLKTLEPNKEHPIIATVNKDKMKIHVLGGDGSITLYGCTP